MYSFWNLRKAGQVLPWPNCWLRWRFWVSLPPSPFQKFWSCSKDKRIMRLLMRRRQWFLEPIRLMWPKTNPVQILVLLPSPSIWTMSLQIPRHHWTKHTEPQELKLATRVADNVYGSIMVRCSCSSPLIILGERQPRMESRSGLILTDSWPILPQLEPRSPFGLFCTITAEWRTWPTNMPIPPIMVEVTPMTLQLRHPGLPSKVYRI